MKKFFLTLTIIIFTLLHASAAPAYPYPVSYQLPDGSELTIQLKGDEWLHWAVSEDGFTVLFNDDGFLEYAESLSGFFVNS